ncbi:adenosylhomocysteinase [Candidatus Desulforudis audaxviator MP104C]|uniref:Adenosylhomocysteinase n=1 Tax=Desulforudis audaxviator (strain MP104C) TaxID=477974 RepID=B1I2P2_DESAP|nr:adenosylhomocysteinase [Candidatus Desulforudis audaxviator]ACA59183.1 adenosylhomocysteinase [Candidatus Desulforudis audaxviator MP104C]AZK59253.1 Adenosylhomocysteinase [Candidatus Desulforudis audaxviator]
MMNCAIRNPDLAPQGRMKIDWVRAHMPVLGAIRAEFERSRPLAGVKVAVSVHLEAKTAYLAEVLKAGGAIVTVTGCNPLSTQDDVAAALVEAGIAVFAWHDPTPDEYRTHLIQTLENGPGIVIDDGGDLVHLLHTDLAHLAPGVIGGCEETTTGVIRLRALAREGRLAFPMFAINDAHTKYLFDNRYGTGESVWSGIMRTTNLLVAGKTVVVFGYGWCGRGIAMRARGLGAKVIVCEVDPVRAIEAHMDGYRVMHSLEAARLGNVFISATGCRDVIHAGHFQVMPDQALLANAGHFNVEISGPDLERLAVSRRTVRPNIEEFQLADGRRLYLLARGRLVNLAAGDGHPAEIMDMSFALQALTALYVVRHAGELEKKLYPVPPEIDRRVAELKLGALGVKLDRLTPEQEEYLAGWGPA